MRNVSTIVSLLLLTACAGQRWLTDNQFQAYVNDLHLSVMSLAEANAKLVSLGFVCQPLKEQVNCARSLNYQYGGQTQQVLLSAPTSPGSGIKVEASLSTVVS